MSLIALFIFTVCTTVTLVSAAILDVGPDSNFYRWQGDEISRTFSAQVIKSEQAYNTNQNFMELSYYSTYDYDRNLKRFYATLTLHLEQPDVN